MNIIKNLSKTVVKNYPDFHLREDLNFSDDGNRFRGFDYKGLPITTLRTDDRTYLSVRVDYLQNDFTWRDWHNTEESNLADEFNGCDEVDLDKLIDNCEKILAKVAELNDIAKTEELDMTAVRERVLEEIRIVDDTLYYAQYNIKWWMLSKYEFSSLKEDMGFLCRDKDRLEEMKLNNFEGETIRRKRQIVQDFENNGWVVVSENSFIIKSIRELVTKYIF